MICLLRRDAWNDGRRHLSEFFELLWRRIDIRELAHEHIRRGHFRAGRPCALHGFTVQVLSLCFLGLEVNLLLTILQGLNSFLRADDLCWLIQDVSSMLAGDLLAYDL